MINLIIAQYSINLYIFMSDMHDIKAWKRLKHGKF